METGLARIDNDRVAAIIDSLDEPAILLDEDDSVACANQAGSEVLGIPPERIIGRSFNELNGETGLDDAKLSAALKELGAGSEAERRISITCELRDKKRRFLVKLSRLCVASGATFGKLIIFQEVPLLRDTGLIQHRAIAAAAHELNTPLTSMALTLGLLQRLTDKQRDLIASVLEDVERMHHVSTDFLSIFENRPRTIMVRNVKVDLARMLTRIIDRFGKYVEEKNIKLATDIGVNLTVSGDPLKLSWVLAALLGNALKFTPEMGTVDVIARALEREVSISIYDSGPGLPISVRNRVFKDSLFGSCELQEAPAAGVRLALAKEIVEAHDGRLFAEMPSENGIKVSLTIPLLQGG